MQHAPSIPTPDGPASTADQRHSSADESEQSQAVPLSPRKVKRLQVSKACTRCKRLQKGCSEYRPCQRCVKVGLASQCIDAARRSASNDVAGASGSLTTQAPLPVSLQSPSRPFTQHFLHREGSGHVGAGTGVLQPDLLAYCLDRFFSRMHPTVPVLSPVFTDSLQAAAASAAEDAASLEAYGLLHAICAMVLLQIDQPGDPPAALPAAASTHGQRLFDEALRAQHSICWRARPIPTLERVLLTFFLYACHVAQSHHSQAFYSLREATTLFLLLKPAAPGSTAQPLQDRLFWVLLVSERSHAIRYRRPITLYITPSSPPLEDPLSFIRTESALAGFWSLAALFAPLNATFIAMMNEEVQVTPTTTAAQTQAPLASATAPLLAAVEDAVNSAIPYGGVDLLHDTQKANLRVTQLWLRIIVWKVRLRLGLLGERAPSASAAPTGDERRPYAADSWPKDTNSAANKNYNNNNYNNTATTSLTYRYPLHVARSLRGATRGLPLEALTVHGVGMTEKLFDVASSVVDVLARVPPAPHDGQDDDDVMMDTAVDTGASQPSPEDDLRYLRGLIASLPGGQEVYDGLLWKHVEQALPGVDI